ncbi:MAG: ABC transporter permease [Dehalococcoidia bacterium]|nr:ABC transporter permease [Dehalococcoidia bacterium]
MTAWYMVIANLKMTFRNRQSLFWALVFPLIFVVVFGLFRLDQPVTSKLVVIDQSKDSISRALIDQLKSITLIRVDESRTLEQAQADLQGGKVNYVLVIPPELEQTVARGTAAPVPLGLSYDAAGLQNNQRMFAILNGFVDQANLSLNHAKPLIAVQGQAIQAKQLRYFDFLLPGFVGMGVMTYAIIEVATVLSLYREQKILKRILASPLPGWQFFAGIIGAHLVLALVQAAIILLAGILLFHGHVYGSYLWIAVLVFLGNIVFLNIGFIVGSFARTPQTAIGLGNAVTMPMMFFSGVFFPTDTLPATMRAVVQYLPLTPMLTALRGVALDAKPIWSFPTELGILAAWVLVTSVVAIRVFRFS